MDKEQKNNSSWCCDRIEELIEKYRNESESSWDIDGACRVYDEVISDLEEVLHGK